MNTDGCPSSNQMIHVSLLDNDQCKGSLRRSTRLRYEFLVWYQNNDDPIMNFLIVCLLISTVGCNITRQVPETTLFPPTLTSFTCHGRLPGYYADLETGCKTYHVCDGNSHFTYICPRRTLFQQRSRICDHSYLVHCEDSPHFYEAENIYPDDEEEVLLRLAESEENLPSKEISDDDDEETEFISTETSEFITETTEISIPPTSSHQTATPGRQNQKTPTESGVVQPKETFSKLDENTIVTKSEREFVLPVEKSDFMKFKNRKNVFKKFSLCPTYCNPKFFLPETCHPCIMIK